MFFFWFYKGKTKEGKNKQAKCCKYDSEGIFMICKSQCSFSPQSSTKKEKDIRETFYAYKQLFSRGHVWHIETVVLCDFYITVSRLFRCQIRRYEKRKRAKSWNICLGSPFFFIYWNINVFASGQVCLCMLFGALTEMPTDAPSLIFFSLWVYLSK